MDGIKIFKRRVLGFFGLGAVKSLDEITKALTDIKLVDSEEMGKEFVRAIADENLDYSSTRFLKLKRVVGKDSREYYAIQVDSYDDIDSYLS